jgi:ATP synthase protein I
MAASAADDLGPRQGPPAPDQRKEPDTSRQRKTEAWRELEERTARKAARKLRARREGDRGIWFGLGMFGLVGWSVSIPTVLGIAIGVWLDHRFPGGISWTLTGLLIGIVVGCFNAWYWIGHEGRR